MLTLEDIANLILIGGWPQNIDKDAKVSQIVSKSYIRDILYKDINEIEDATNNLLNFYEKVDKKPKFMRIICGLWDYVVQDHNTGIYIIPITVLKP